MTFVFPDERRKGLGEGLTAHLLCRILLHFISFFHGATARSGPGPLHYRGFMITLKLCNILQDGRLDRDL
jgi:hypothetical protein